MNRIIHNDFSGRPNLLQLLNSTAVTAAHACCHNNKCCLIHSDSPSYYFNVRSMLPHSVLCYKYTIFSFKMHALFQGVIFHTSCGFVLQITAACPILNFLRPLLLSRKKSLRSRSAKKFTKTNFPVPPSLPLWYNIERYYTCADLRPDLGRTVASANRMHPPAALCPKRWYNNRRILTGGFHG